MASYLTRHLQVHFKAIIDFFFITSWAFKYRFCLIERHQSSGRAKDYSAEWLQWSPLLPSFSCDIPFVLRKKMENTRTWIMKGFLHFVQFSAINVFYLKLLSWCIYIYIYIWRERGGEKGKKRKTCIFVCMCLCIYIIVISGSNSTSYLDTFSPSVPISYRFWQVPETVRSLCWLASIIGASMCGSSSESFALESIPIFPKVTIRPFWIVIDSV